MAQATVYTCDRCCAEKRAANHWFYVIKPPHGNSLGIFKWHGKPPEAATGERHLCGEACLIAEVGEFAGGSRD